MLTLALPNGTLREQTITFFSGKGINFRGTSGRRYQVSTSDSRISRATFMNPRIIPSLVGNRQYDLGITGSDLVAEAGDCRASTLGKLCYDRPADHEWRTVLLGGKDDPATSLRDIQDDTTILTEYPRITREALEKAGKRATLRFSRGSTEALVPGEFRYGVCIASSNATLEANGLKIIQVFSVERAVVVGGRSILDGGKKEEAARSLLGDLLG